MKYNTLVLVDNKLLCVRKLCKFTYVGCKNKLCKFSHQLLDIVIDCQYNKCKGDKCMFYHDNLKTFLANNLFPHMLNILLECYLNFPFMNFTIKKNYIYKFNLQTISDIIDLYTKFNYHLDFTQFSQVYDSSLEIPKLKRCNQEIYENKNLYNDSISECGSIDSNTVKNRLQLSLNKLQIDNNNINEIENLGAHDGAGISLYPINQQFKWFFMNNSQKLKLLDDELNEYKTSQVVRKN
jgi:hypothetical protein